ncbi:MAG: NUDIX domain-containing protein [Alphaproteobacteria bacterium]
MGFVGSYLWRIRQKVGNERLIMPGVGILLVNEKKQILCGKRSDSGEWSYPGGAMEIGQSITDCLREEALEEFGIEIGNEFRLVGMLTNPSRTSYTYPNGHEIQIVNFLFEVSLNGRDVKMDDEHTEFGWFDIENLPQPFKQDTFEAIKMYKIYLQTNVIQLD